jgi:hypothetical protein
VRNKKPGNVGRGRPPLPAGAAKRASFNTRLRQSIKERLEGEAAKAGRSLSEEIERRLEASLEHEDTRTRFYGGPELDALFKQVASAAEIIELQRGKSWIKDYETFIAFNAALNSILRQLEGLRPQASPHSVTIVKDLFELRPEQPDVPKPTEAELTEEAYLSEKVGFVAPVLGGFTPLAKHRFASVDEARRAAELWAEHDRRYEEYDRRSKEVSAYFHQFTKLGEQAAAEPAPSNQESPESKP